MDALVTRRRSRKRPASTGVEFSLQKRDWLWLSRLHRHGDLPTCYLLAYSQTLGLHNDTRAKERLTTLHYEDNHPHQSPNRQPNIEGIKYLSFPDEQFKTQATNQQYVHSLGNAGKLALQQAGLWRDAAVFDHQWIHNFMTSTFTAAVELACLAEPKKYTYIFHDEIVPDGCSFALEYEAITGAIHKPRQTPKGKPFPNLVPDRFFGITYHETGKTIYYVVETDRGTYPLSSDPTTKTLMDNIYQYRTFIGNGEYKKLGLDGGLVALFLISKPPRLTNALRDMKHGQNYIAFKAEPFWNQTVMADLVLYIPTKVMSQLFTEPWERKGRAPGSLAEGFK